MRPLGTREEQQEDQEEEEEEEEGDELSGQQQQIAQCYEDDRPLLSESGSMKLVVPTWLNDALARQQQQLQRRGEGGERGKWCSCQDGSRCLHCTSDMSANDPGVAAVRHLSNSSYNNWLSVPVPAAVQADGAAGELLAEARGGLPMQHSHGSVGLQPLSGSTKRVIMEHLPPQAGGNRSQLIDEEALDAQECMKLQTVGLKADIVSHPLYEQLLEAHVACLRIATPVDHLPKIDGQLVHCHHITAKYSVMENPHVLFGNNKDELDHFMTQYLLLLRSFKERLQHHVCVHAKEAVIACRELEYSLLSLTGVSPGEGSGEGMSDEEEEQSECEFWQDDLGFGPLIPSETERTLMEHVRQELKHELKQGYRARIADVREEILRKRRAGKLPGDTTSVLKAWWHAHSKWPYPTEDEKARLVQETGLEMKQINNWFINQRKRNWHHHPTSVTASSKAKAKR